MPRNDVLQTPAGPPWMLRIRGSLSPVLYEDGSHSSPSMSRPSLLFHVIARICATSTSLNQAFASVMAVVLPLAASTIVISPGWLGALRVPARRDRSFDVDETDIPTSPVATGLARPVDKSSS